jgi:hypothetical protein
MGKLHETNTACAIYPFANIVKFNSFCDIGITFRGATANRKRVKEQNYRQNNGNIILKQDELNGFGYSFFTILPVPYIIYLWK